LAWTLGLASVLMAAATVAIAASMGRLGEVLGPSVTTAAGLGVMGGLVGSRRPGNAVGWLLLFIALTQGIVEITGAYAALSGGNLPGWEIANWLGTWMWIPGLGTMATFMLLLFPTGHLPSPAWRWLAWVAALALAAVVVGAAASTWSTRADLGGGAGPPPGAPGLIVRTAVLVLAACMLGSVASLFARYQRGTLEERQQLKWILFGTVILVAAICLSFVNSSYPVLLNVLINVLVICFPASVAVGILRYRLFDIDLVIRRTLLYGSLAAGITAVYVAIVVGIGSVIGQGRQLNLPLSILATAVVAVAFQPMRERLQRVANRLVYGKRATPYEVLAEFAQRVSGEYATEEVLPRIARLLVEGTGATGATVWLRVDAELRPAATWPEAPDPPYAPVPVIADELPPIPDVSRAVGVRHQGELLGALTLTTPGLESLSPVEEKLLNDLASQASLVLRNVRLTAELQARLDEITRQAAALRLSRQRIVAAQDAQRRRLERNIHDGAQQHLVALAIKLRLAGTLAQRDPERARILLRELQAETVQAQETLRDLAQGIYPPLLRERGLPAALQAQAEKMDASVVISADGLGRHPIELEAAVYFCCLEALQNIAKYADARRVRVELSADTELRFAVTDDGKGFDVATASKGSGLQNMADRLAALDGGVQVTSRLGHGTRISGRVPLAGTAAPEP
jgi:signal transduction histidine kinase